MVLRLIKNLSISSSRVFFQLFAILALLMSLECGTRLWFFGPDAIYHFARYTPIILKDSPLVVPVKDPSVNFRLKSHLQTYFQGARFSTNEFGVRGHAFSKDPTPGITRIAVLGASITMGFGVSDAQTYPQRLQDLLNQSFPKKYEVLNFAVGGYDYEQALEFYESFVSKFHPDIVMCPIYYGDLDKPARIEKLSSTWKKRTTWKDKIDLKQQLRKYSFFFWALRIINRQWFQDHGADWGQKIRDSKNDSQPQLTNRQVLETFIQKRHSENVPVLLYSVKLPEEQPLTKLIQQQNELHEWSMHQTGCTLLDLHADLDHVVTRKDVIYPFHDHPNAHVYTLYAQALYHRGLPLFQETALKKNQLQ
jgi:hypothetical protein